MPLRPPALAAVAVVLLAASPPPRAEPFLRGMTVSCPRWGEVWGSPAMAEALVELRGLGVEWVAIHPYAAVARDGTVRYRATDGPDGDYLRRAVALANAAGVELFWKPHVAYWGTFAWRGDVAFGDDAAAWERFFAGYRGWIVDQARFAEAAGARLFAVGVELEATTHREREWREVVAAVRAVYSGRLVYAANWDRVDAVPFWDAVDLLGVQGYHPLAEADDPDAAALAAGWDRVLGELGGVARRHGKRVLFAEVGYDRSPHAARRPWERHREAIADEAAAIALRRRLIAVALDRLEREPWIVGAFWWKWMPGTSRDHDFSMRAAEARDALRAAWAPPAPTPTSARGRG